MPLIDTERLLQALDRDAEFALAARFLTATLKLGFGDTAMLLEFRDGRLHDLRAQGPFDPYDIEIAAPESGWREFLQPVPRPFYHHFLAAVRQEDFTWGGDIETAFAYMPMLNRLFELMRAEARPEENDHGAF